MVTGWGERAFGAGIDEVFQLSDHADYDGLIRLVETVRPQKTYVVHGYARTFARDLRNRGYDAEAVPGHSGPDEDDQPTSRADPGPPPTHHNHPYRT